MDMHFSTLPREIKQPLTSVAFIAPRKGGFSPRMSESDDIYYVVLRGGNRHPLFENDSDRAHFSSVVAQAAAHCRITVYAYCWLETEARMAVKITDTSINRFAHSIAKHHAQRLEREVALTGSHFEQKCRGVKVDGQSALLDLVRHIHMAPLKAGLATDVAEYSWSSHRVYLGLDSTPWVATDPLLSRLGQQGGSGVDNYIKFMNQAAANIDPAGDREGPSTAKRPLNTLTQAPKK